MISRHHPAPAAASLDTDSMSASLKPLTVDEFLAWERAQPNRYEFDGIQPVAMTGGSFVHARTIARLIAALETRLRPPCEVIGPELKVLTADRVRYPDASVVCSSPEDDGDTIEPTIVFAVLSPSTAASRPPSMPPSLASLPMSCWKPTAPQSPSAVAPPAGKPKPS